MDAYQVSDADDALNMLTGRAEADDAVEMERNGGVAGDAAWDWTNRQTRRLADRRGTNAEVLSALATRERRGVLDTSHRLTVHSLWLDMHSALRILPIGERSIALATTSINSLPAGDALHMAVAVEHGCETATLDRDMADAARQRGMTVHATPSAAT